jgi:uncharacterized protein
MKNKSFKRHAEQDLLQWKNKSNRKPLILRGARQVGKTTLVEQFSKHYEYAVFLNLERQSDIHYFEEFDDVKMIVEALMIVHDFKHEKLSQTLLFIDEIQESPKAISLLRYFYEDIPQLHVIAAGSLLEQVMGEVKNFPVGRVEYLHLHPLNFSEYLIATNQPRLEEELNTVPVTDVAHTILINAFNKYAIIGGMPEVIKTYLINNSVADLKNTYESIWSTYKNDVEKYASNKTEERVIKHIMQTAHLYIDQRIKFENFGHSNYRSREVSEAMKSLDEARVIQLIYPSTDVQSPIKPDMKKSPRLQFLDTGWINYERKIQADMLAINDLSFSYKGAIIPHLIYQEVISLQTKSYKKPNFWVREKTQASSEVDLVYEYQNKIIPIEIKSGSEGKLKSLHQFIEQTNHGFAIRIYGGKFNIERHFTPKAKKPYVLMNLPYYLGTKLPEYVAYLLQQVPHGQ